MVPRRAPSLFTLATGALYLFLLAPPNHWAAKADEFAWFDAIAEGDARVISEMLSAGSHGSSTAAGAGAGAGAGAAGPRFVVDPNYPDEDGYPPLVSAARLNHGDAVLAALVDAGADLEAAADYPAQVL